MRDGVQQGELGRWQGERFKESKESLKTSLLKVKVQVNKREVVLWVSMEGLFEMYKRQLHSQLKQGTRLLRVNKLVPHLF